MELKVSYRRPDVIDHVAATINLLNANFSNGPLCRWWVTFSTFSCFSPSRRCFSTSCHDDNNRLKLGASVMAHAVVPSSMGPRSQSPSYSEPHGGRAYSAI